MVSGVPRGRNAYKLCILQRKLHPSHQAEAPALFHDRREKKLSPCQRKYVQMLHFLSMEEIKSFILNLSEFCVGFYIALFLN